MAETEEHIHKKDIVKDIQELKKKVSIIDATVNSVRSDVKYLYDNEAGYADDIEQREIWREDIEDKIEKRLGNMEKKIKEYEYLISQMCEAFINIHSAYPDVPLPAILIQ